MRADRLPRVVLLVVLVGLFGPSAVRAQDPERPRRPVAGERRGQPLVPDSLRGDSLGRVPGAVDTAAARELGLPTSPSRSFPAADSIIRALMELQGYRATRYAADSLTLMAETTEIQMTGSTLVEREGSTLEADSVTFRDSECRMVASGDPALFDGGTVLIGEGMSYDTCGRRGIVARALTNFNQGGTNWYLRGELAIDSASTRIYSADGNLTSCELPEPHYHFAVGRVKWVSNNIMVARPVTLYVRDVPILWLPFIFQDVRRGRRSGFLVPRFGINDLIRPSQGYRRSVSNVGYYFALSDYYDAQLSVDWYAETSVTLNGRFQYRWLDRFMNGSLGLSRIWENGFEGQPGARSLRLSWQHQQQFDQRTRLSANVDYATSSRIVERNAVDPFLVTATLRSQLNFSKQFDWGSLSIGGSRSQNISNDEVTEDFPSVTVTPRAIDIASGVTWQPGLSFRNTRNFNQPGGVVEVPSSDSVPLFDTLTVSRRNTSFDLRSPLRLGSWQLNTNFRFSDFISNQRTTETVVDSTTGTETTRTFGSDFNTGVDWDASLNLPQLFSSTWRLTPSITIANTLSSQPFWVRNRNSGGSFVSQSKRATFGASVRPTVFGFFPGIGPIARIRHSVSPLINWSYAPSATLPQDFARVIDPTGNRVRSETPASHTVSLGLSQTFEGKFSVPEGDTLTDPRNARKLKIFNLQTSAIRYDFEQAKEEGRNGWATQSLSNTLTSDLLPGLSLTTSHDLWDGQVGFDSVPFDPFLSRVSARFSITGSTLSRIAALIAGNPEPSEPGEDIPDDELLDPEFPYPNTADPRTRDEQRYARPLSRGMRASFNFDIDRRRPDPVTGEELDGNKTLQMTVGFSPTTNWSMSWNTVYNFTEKEFGQQVLRLDRDLHRWRATFSFTKAANGNLAFNFFVSLTDQPDIKFNYDQRTIAR